MISDPPEEVGGKLNTELIKNKYMYIFLIIIQPATMMMVIINDTRSTTTLQ